MPLLLQKFSATTARLQVDTLIAGCGAAGLYAALNLPSRMKCCILAKAGLQTSNSMYAQGGISAVIPCDTIRRQLHEEDTLSAGAGLCDEAAVQVLVESAADEIQRLITLGVPFDQKDGQLLCTREGGHRERRILHCGGDATGLHLTETLLEEAKRRENITFLENAVLAEICTDACGVTGALVLTKNETPLLIQTRRIILATGGIGRIYPNSTNAVCATGDGIAAALRAGASLKHMEFVQFHPTVLIGQKEEGRSFLISEALRGEGARLVNDQGAYFMQDVHPMADLAPRDIVARAIVQELTGGKAAQIYLDITHKSRAFLQGRFPTIYAECMKQGIDIASQRIPVHPVQHYMMGGIRTGIHGETSIPGLYACGETACTGVHGANRLASNSLLECIVFGRRAALHAASHSLPEEKPALPVLRPSSSQPIDYKSVQQNIRTIMHNNCGILRDEAGLAKAKMQLKDIEKALLKTYVWTKEAVETLNMVQTAYAIAYSAYQRKESVGAHYRCDDKEVNTCKYLEWQKS